MGEALESVEGGVTRFLPTVSPPPPAPPPPPPPAPPPPPPAPPPPSPPAVTAPRTAPGLGARRVWAAALQARVLGVVEGRPSRSELQGRT